MSETPPNKDLPPEAHRALAAAAERRKAAKELKLAPELGGRVWPSPRVPQDRSRQK